MSMSDGNPNREQTQFNRKFGQRHPEAIIAVGMGVGGLKSLEKMLPELRTSWNAAFVIVQHLQSDTPNVLAEQIAKHTELSVQLLENDLVSPAANRVYVGPPQSIVKLKEGGLYSELSEDAEKRAAVVDSLFLSLAEHSKVPVIGVVLSGDGCDGVIGCKSICDSGGMTIAELTETAANDSMPRAASLSGNADHVVSPEQIPDVIENYLKHIRRVSKDDNEQQLHLEIEAELARICDVLLKVTDHDFRHYKKNTLLRRVSRRMHVLRCQSAAEYLERLQNDREESHSLFRELLIGVTSFFRDPDTFATLSNYVIPKIVESNLKKNSPVRIWVPGCATGEEAYTLAILLSEELDRHEEQIEVKIFATDINQRALNTARRGVYPATITDVVSESRLNRFFTRSGPDYVVAKPLREMCVFSVHNLISDPPFSQMDLISCRNLLIYLGQPLQLKLIPMFHFALKQKGYLLLGPSENLTSHTEIFHPIDSKHRISQRKPGPARSAELLSSSSSKVSGSSSSSGSNLDIDIHQISQRIVLDEFAPRYAVVNENGHLICTSTGLERYLEFPDGPFQNSIVKVAKSGLRSGLRNSLREANESLRTVRRNDLTLKSDGAVERIGLVVQPMPELGDDNNLFMVVFQELGKVVQRPDTDGNTTTEAEALIEQLERELERTRTDLEQAVQDLEGSNEELKSSNEELLSINEELQSANEELETSKEEIQSGLEALSRSQHDLQNLLEGTRIATIFLDRNWSIVRFTPSIVDIYNIKDGDIGRPLGDITHNAVDMPTVPEIEPLEQQADEDKRGHWLEDELQVNDGRYFMRRILPYRYDGTMSGVILTFVDITEQKKSALRVAAARKITNLLAFAESSERVIPKVLELLCDEVGGVFAGLWILGPDKTLSLHDYSVTGDLESLSAFSKRSQSIKWQKGEGFPGRVWEVEQMLMWDQLSENPRFVRREEALEASIQSCLASPIKIGQRFRGVVEVYSMDTILRDSSLMELMANFSHEIGQFIRRRNLDEALLDSEARKSAILNSALDAIITMDIEGNVVDLNSIAEAAFGYERDEIVGESLAEKIIPPKLRDAHRTGMKRFLQSGESEIIGKRIELTAQKKDGSQFPVELSIAVSNARDGSPFFTSYLRDISEQKRLADELQNHSKRLQMALRAGNMAAWEWAPERSYWTEDVYRLLGISSDREASTETFFSCVHPDDLPELTAAWKFATSGAGGYEHEFRIIRPDGEIRWLWGVGEVERDSAGNVIRIYGLNGDSTTERNVEESLRLSRKQAEVANVSKTEFLANMSHEIRTPMSAILGYADILANHLTDPDNVNCVSIIQQNGRFLLEIINDILDISKIEAGKLEHDKKPIELRKLMNDIRDLMSVRAADKMLDFDVRFDGDLPEKFVSDEKRLKQILVNLIGNAIKFTDTGSVDVVVSASKKRNRYRLIFSVIDTGIGLTAGQIDTIFQPFTQANASVDREFGGTGLGLAISQRLAELLGGEVSVKSRPQKGSTFKLSIDLTGDEELFPLTLEGEPSTDPPNEQPLPARLSFEGNILVVDDRREIRFIAQHFIEDAGGTVATAENGQEALDLVEQAKANSKNFDLIVIDMQMPVMDGYEAVRRLRANGCSLPIIALTAHAMQGDRDRCLEAGCTDYISKPLDGPLFNALLARYLNKEK